MIKTRLSVIGTGYLGATNAACMAELGHCVIGVDVDPVKVARLNAGEAPFFEPDLPELLRRHVGTDRLRFTTCYAEAAEGADVHFVCVGTPQRAGSYAADTAHVEAAFTRLAREITRPALIVGKSTVPIGTARRMRDVVNRLQPSGRVEVAWSPEFLNEGSAVADTLAPIRLIFGVESASAEAALRVVYAPMIEAGIPVRVMDFTTAELVKVAANSFMATKISFINAMAEVCEAVGADVTRLSDALGLDDRIGPKQLTAGLGFGGGCLPKDIRAFIARTEELGVDQAVAFLRDIDDINQRRRSRMIDLSAEVMGGSVQGARVAVLGAAFKPGSDDVRDSPALDVATRMQALGARVCVYDPVAMPNARRLQPQLDYGPSLEDTVTAADLVMLLTEWPQFRAMEARTIGRLVARRNIVDGRTALDPTVWRAAGWNYRALGRP